MAPIPPLLGALGFFLLALSSWITHKKTGRRMSRYEKAWTLSVACLSLMFVIWAIVG